MGRPRRNAPSWGKWWFDDWLGSSLRRRHLKTAAQRGIYRELWDLCMSSPEPGKAVDSGGNAWTDSELAAEIGCRVDHFRKVVETLLEQGKITRGARLELTLSTASVKKSLPHARWYKRLAMVNDAETPNSGATYTDADADEVVTPDRTPEWAGPDRPNASTAQVAQATKHLRAEFGKARGRDTSIPVIAKFDSWVQQVMRDGNGHQDGLAYALGITAEDFISAFESYLNRPNHAVTWTGTWVQNARNARVSQPTPVCRTGLLREED